MRGVDLAHARIHRHPHVVVRRGAARLAGVFGHGQQGVDRQHRLVGAEGQPLRHRTCGAQAGEGARPAAEGNRLQRSAVAGGQFAGLTPKLEYSMLGRTYALGHEPDLDDWLFEKPKRAVTNRQSPWAVWYPLRRSGKFANLPEQEQRVILSEHGTIGTTDGQAYDSDYWCHRTVFQYNSSYQNEGGFMLICSPGNAVNEDTIIRYNVSVHDGINSARVFHFGGGATRTHVYNNTIVLAPHQNLPMLLFTEWNKGTLESYLIEITAEVLRQVAAETGKPLVDVIVDAAEQKGTGRWTVKSALDLGVPVTGIAEAVFARALSGSRNQRAAAQAQGLAAGSLGDKPADAEQFAADIQAKAHGTAAPRLVAACTEAIAPPVDSESDCASTRDPTTRSAATAPSRTGSELMPVRLSPSIDLKSLRVMIPWAPALYSAARISERTLGVAPPAITAAPVIQARPS